MPIKSGKKSMADNVSELMGSGYPQKQAVAISYAKAGKHRKKKPKSKDGY